MLNLSSGSKVTAVSESIIKSSTLPLAAVTVRPTLIASVVNGSNESWGMGRMKMSAPASIERSGVIWGTMFTTCERPRVVVVFLSFRSAGPEPTIIKMKLWPSTARCFIAASSASKSEN